VAKKAQDREGLVRDLRPGVDRERLKKKKVLPVRYLVKFLNHMEVEAQPAFQWG